MWHKDSFIPFTAHATRCQDSPRDRTQYLWLDVQWAAMSLINGQFLWKFLSAFPWAPSELQPSVAFAQVTSPIPPETMFVHVYSSATSNADHVCLFILIMSAFNKKSGLLFLSPVKINKYINISWKMCKDGLEVNGRWTTWKCRSIT